MLLLHRLLVMLPSISRKPDSSEVAEVLDSVPGDSWTASQPQDCGLTDPLRKEPDLDLGMLGGPLRLTEPRWCWWCAISCEADIATLSSSLNLEITDSRSTEDRPEGGNRVERRGSLVRMSDSVDDRREGNLLDSCSGPRSSSRSQNAAASAPASAPPPPLSPNSLSHSMETCGP